MKTRTLGRTGLRISELSVGSSQMSVQGQTVATEGIRAAIDLGVNYFDTAPYYSAGADEEMLGQALTGVRNRVVLATKIGYTTNPADHRSAGGLMRQLEGSLGRLKVDHVDVLQVHESDFRKWWTDEFITAEEGLNPKAPLIRDDEKYDFAGAPVVQFLAQAKAAGKARFVGITGKDARRVARVAQALDIDTVMVAHQFNPVMRNAGRFLLPETTARNLGVLVAAPLMQGLLARPKLNWRAEPPSWMDPVFFNAYFGFIDLAEKAGIGVQELTFRWLLTEPRLHSILFGFRSAEEIRANVEAALRGPLPASLQSDIDALGIVHPLVFQGRTTI